MTRDKISTGPPQDSPLSPLVHPPRGSHPSTPIPPPNPQLPEGRPMECSPMIREVGKQYGGGIPEP